jgi:hypothetical protein
MYEKYTPVLRAVLPDTPRNSCAFLGVTFLEFTGDLTIKEKINQDAVLFP